MWLYDYFGNKMGHSGVYLEGAGTSYSYINSLNSLTPDENDDIISIYTISKINLEFSEDGNSAKWVKTIEETVKETYTQNLVLTLFKE